MQKQQVIRFSGTLFDGSIGETLRGGPVDLAKMGEISVRRSSEIMFDEQAQQYYVCFLESQLLHHNEQLRKELFDTYELAVAHEVEILNKERRLGNF